MKRVLRTIVSLALSASLVLACATPALASFEDFKDVKGHWAENTLRQAYADGILKGSDVATMAPNHSITVAQAATVLCRVLHVAGQGDTTALEIPAGAWYAQDMAKAVYAGLIDNSAAGTLDKPILRGDAFCLFGRAFQMTKADPNLSVLNKFPDTLYLTGEAKRAAASLVQEGIISGSEGSLQTDRPLTRAEFATILYRLIDNYSTTAAYTGKENAGTMISGDAVMTGLKAGKIWFDQSVSNISLANTSAALAVVRSDTLASFSLTGTGRIDQLILAEGSGDVDLELPDTYALGTLTVGEGAGTVTVSGTLSDVEVTGNNRSVFVNSAIDTLAISGNGNTVTLGGGCTVSDIVVSGSNNIIKLGDKVKALLLAGRDNSISGNGRIDQVTLNTQYYTLNVPQNKLIPWTAFGLGDVEVRLSAPTTLPAGEKLRATAYLTVPEEDKGKLCTGSWYLNGEKMSEEPLILGKDTPSSSITPNYTHDMQQEGTVQFVLSYENTDGDTFTQDASSPVYLDTFSDLGLADAVVQVTVPEILSAGQSLTATAVVETPERGQACTGTWYVDGKQVSSAPLTLGDAPTALSYQYDYYYGMPEISTVTYRVTYTTQDGRKQEISGKASLSLENFADNGIAHATASLNAPGTLEAGKTLEVTARLSYPEGGKICTGTWYVDGKQVSSQTVVLGTDIPKLTHKYKYTENMKTTSEVKFVLTYTTPDGRAQKVTATQKVTLKNYDYFYYHNLKPEDVLKSVTSGYIGDYTLAWAQNHDYTKEVKTAWVNLKGYTSKTKYLVWVNLTYQRVNIFSGSQGNWTLVRQALCGTGKAGTPTIRGVFTTSYKQPAWDYGSYYCGPIVRFNGSSGYAFHSRLQYWPMNSDRYYDARIGFPISHGCLRMYNDDIWWMYNNIPNGTTVVVY